MNEFWLYWQFDFTTATLLLLFVVAAFSAKGVVRSACFWVSTSLVVICFCSPLSVLSTHYLFSAHMVVHVLLLLVVGPLLLMSLPAGTTQFAPFFLFLKNHPVVGWLTGLGMMWFWHVPIIFNTAMATAHHSSFSYVSVLESCSLVAAGVLFAAPVLHPNKAFRVDALSGVVYLFTACIGCSLLGLLVTFAPPGTYRHFLAHADGFRLNELILNAGITQVIDQQAAGLIMWVPCCLLYVSGAMYLLVQWFDQKETIEPVNQI